MKIYHIDWGFDKNRHLYLYSNEYSLDKIIKAFLLKNNYKYFNFSFRGCKGLINFLKDSSFSKKQILKKIQKRSEMLGEKNED